MNKKSFNTPFTDYQDRNGEDFEILRPCTKEDNIDIEVGVMYKIRFRDGVEIDAYPEEIFQEHNFTF